MYLYNMLNKVIMLNCCEAACYVLVERSARLELDGYDYVV